MNERQATSDDESDDFDIPRIDPARKEGLLRVLSVSTQARARPALEDHTSIRMAFEANLRGQWVYDPKVEDRFTLIDTYLKQQEEQLKSASKRSSDPLIESDRPKKRVRGVTHPSSMPRSLKLMSSSGT